MSSLPKAPHTVPAGLETLVDALIADQQRLTAVERFSQRHLGNDRPALETHYRDLIPLSLPRPGEQYAFEVDLDRCSACKGCVTACHSLNGLDDGESWRSVGFLIGEQVVPSGTDLGAADTRQSNPRNTAAVGRSNRVIPLQQTVTTACHHCADPACLNGCPVLAYDKDPLTGIVRHLDDQCIGCSYCILKCPYEVPQFSKRLGIVRKCDLCHDRLAEGEAPACVQACPSEAIRITTVRPRELEIRFRESAGTECWLPDAPDPTLSVPTTQYRTAHSPVTLRAADHGRPQPAALHAPLVIMLVLTQAGLGGLVASSLHAGEYFAFLAGLGSSLVLVLGLVASVFHLGQPKKAWRIWMGWRTSWLSREALILGTASGFALLAVVWMGSLLPDVPNILAPGIGLLRVALAPMPLVTLPALLIGITGASVAAQSMVYADTGRAFWALRHTAPRFAGTTIVLGLATLWVLQPNPFLGLLLASATGLKLAMEVALLKHADSDDDRWTALRRTAALQRGPLRPLLALRLLLGFLGGMLLPFGIWVSAIGPMGSGAVILTLLLAELLERALFFLSVSPDTMPGLPE
ncbi:MAG: dimethyl sulfoxide reductase anchor subunit [Verrucomicrobia bacterium]|nr:dimethyl sulfoxide reductase anchor subunit [Verrucomicrobiota bacterium]